MKESNSKNNKLIFVYALIMLVCVAAVVVIGIATSPAHDVSENPESQTVIDEKQNSIRLLEETVTDLEDEVENLKVEKNKYIAQVEELEKQVEELSAKSFGDDFENLKNIYANYKGGQISEAKEAFSQIDPTEYNDATLAYYEILKELIEQ